MNRGDVLHYPDFEFLDGGHANKLLVILAIPTGGDRMLAVKTTSVAKKRRTDPGCQAVRREFFIKAGKLFPQDTWIVLSSMPFLLPIQTVMEKIAKKECQVVVTLPSDVVNAIRNCLEKFSDDLNQIHRDMLR
jgi:hypothetical protein